MQGHGSNYGFVRALYERVLHREPDDVGLFSWVVLLNSGTSRNVVADGFMQSIEGRTDRVIDAYRQVLNRYPDPVGLAGWPGLLNSVDDLVLRADLTASAEILDQATRAVLPAGSAPTAGTGDCGAPGSQSPGQWQQLFGGFHTSSWSGGDGGVTAPLSPGVTVFVHGDTYLGPLKPDGTRPPNPPFLRNSMVLSVGGCLVPLLAPGHGEAIPSPSPTQWYWPTTPIVDDGQLWLLSGRMTSAGSGPLGFEQQGIDLARFTIVNGVPSFQSVQPTPMSYDTEISWGTGVGDDGISWFIYGTRTNGFGKDLYVARVPHGQIANQKAWQFAAQLGWSSNPSDATPLLTPGISSVGSALTVWRRLDGTWTMVSKNYDFSSHVGVWAAPAPTGPWILQSQSDLPVIANRYGHELLSYAVAAYPDFGNGDQVTVSYDYLDLNPVPNDNEVDPYMPKFTTVNAPG